MRSSLRFFILCPAIAAVLACAPRQPAPAPSSALPAGSAAAPGASSEPADSADPDEPSARVLAFSGSLRVFRSGAETLPAAGFPLREGDRLVTGPASTADLSAGGAALRLGPDTDATLRVLRGEEEGAAYESVEFSLDAGTLGASAAAAGPRDELVVLAPDFALQTRGAELYLSSGKGDGESAFAAVRSGAASVYPRSVLFDSLLDGRRGNPAAGAAAAAAFALGPSLAPGSAVVPSWTAASVEASLEGASRLVIAAERAASSGAELGEAEDPLPLLEKASPADWAAAKRLLALPLRRAAFPGAAAFPPAR